MKRNRGPRATDLLRDFPPELLGQALDGIPERNAKHLYRSLLVIVPIALISVGTLIWCLFALPLWVGLPGGIGAIALGFWVVLHLVNRVMPEKWPVNKEC